MATEPDEGQPAAAPGRPPGRVESSAGPHADGKPPDRGPTPRSAHTVRWVLLLSPILAVVVGIGVVLSSLPDGRAVPGAGGTASDGAASAGVVSTPSPGYLVSLDELRRRGEQAAAGEEPYASAVADLMNWADGAVDDVSRPVQPLVVEGTDNQFVDDARRAYGLGLAYGISADERYAEAARRTIRDWMDVAITTGDTCPDSGGCHTSLIIGRAGAGFAFGADLIASSAVWTDDDRVDLGAWMRNVILPAASERPNNWGDAGTFVRVVAADYAGDQAEFDRAIDKWRSLIDLIEPDGRIPEEVRRGDAGILYTQEALQYKLGVARIAERRGINLWDYVGAQGGSLRKAIDRLADYWYRPEDWPDYAQPRVPSTGPMWEIAYAHWKDPRWIDIMLDSRPYGDRGHSAIRWTTLTNGVPVEVIVAGGPSGSPMTTPPPRPTPSPTATVAPTTLPITGLAVRIPAPLAGTLRIAITWDAPPQPGAAAELERSVDGGDWSALPIARDGHSASDALRPGQVNSYRVRATVAGSPGPWAELRDVAAERFEASIPSVERTGSWKNALFRGYSAGSALSTDTTGATLTWRGSTQSIVIVGPTGPTRGRMIITVDGVRADVVDLRSSRFRARNVLFTRSWSDAAVHEIVIEARPAGGRRTVAVDDIVTLTSTFIAPPGS